MKCKLSLIYKTLTLLFIFSNNLFSSHFNFKSNSATIKINSGANFCVDNQLDDFKGTIIKDEDANIYGQDVVFNEGNYRNKNSKVKFSGNLSNEQSQEKIKLNGNKIFTGKRGDVLESIEYTQAQKYTEYDTQISAFADNVKDVRVQLGPEVQMQLGNMFEGFIFRSAFLDLYYNFRVKWKDYIGGNLTRDIWAVDLLKDNTYQIEHKIGGEFSYQFDSKTRFKLGLDFVFAGRNVARNLEVFGNISVEF